MTPVVQDNTNRPFDYVADDTNVVNVDDDVCVVDVDAQDFGFVKILTCCSSGTPSKTTDFFRTPQFH